MQIINSYLSQFNIQSPNPMQEAMLAAFEQYNDLLLISPTGSGKTLGYLLPLAKHLQTDTDQVQGLIICPSRELALQIEKVFKTMATGFKICCFYGGHPIRSEKDTLTHPPAVIVGTPGRIADHLRQQTFSAEFVKTLVLDEFDKSLELGFEEEMQFIVSQLSNVQKRLFVSATNLTRLPDFVGVDKVYEVKFSEETNSKLKVSIVRADGQDKLDILFRLLCQIGDAPTLVFCNHRMAVDRISQLLGNKQIHHDVYHGGLKQEEREQALAKFRNDSYRILLATDLAGRGLDIPAIKHVVHYQLAETAAAYVHRNGRTARMHAEGAAYIVLAEDEKLPGYINETPDTFRLPDEIEMPAAPEWKTLRFAAGKKEKISKGDIAGFLMQKGLLAKEEIGLIEVYDLVAYAAVKAAKAPDVVEKVRNEKIKKKKIPVSLSW